MKAQPIWRKSTYSTGEAQSDCVEAANLGEGLRGLRDSKHPESGHLAVTGIAFAKLVRTVKAL